MQMSKFLSSILIRDSKSRYRAPQEIATAVREICVCVEKCVKSFSPTTRTTVMMIPRSSFVSNRIRRGFHAGDPSISRGILAGDDTWLLRGTRPRPSVVAPYYYLPSRLPRPRWTQWGDPQRATGSRTACTPRKCAWIFRDTRVPRGRANNTSKIRFRGRISISTARRVQESILKSDIGWISVSFSFN